jgi:hypothetical protein
MTFGSRVTVVSPLTSHLIGNTQAESSIFSGCPTRLLYHQLIA